ncbi:MAG: phosphatase [Candidatus Atribacteria bacterium]|nr:phosphatase [Candidatus Atribacteria bacterium]
MVRIWGDLHVHTIASGHGYSTVLENVHVALRKGLKVLGIADHSPSMPGGPSPLYFEARGHFPKEIEGIRVYFGAEVDIVDFDGRLDLEDKVLRKLDFVIVSFHPQVFRGGTREENTEALLRALENPLVDIVAHPGNPRFPLDYNRVVEETVARGKVIEINNSSFSVSRKGSKENCRVIAREVEKRGGWVVVSSDAHFCEEVGEFREALGMLQEMQFPEDKILNASCENLIRFFENREGRES